MTAVLADKINRRSRYSHVDTHIEFFMHINELKKRFITWYLKWSIFAPITVGAVEAIAVDTSYMIDTLAAVFARCFVAGLDT